MMKSVRRILYGFLIYGFGFNAQSLAQDRPLKKINWGHDCVVGGHVDSLDRQGAKIYERNGLDVEIVLLRGSGQSSQALLGGSLFAAPVALPQVMLANLNGADLVNVAHTMAVGEQQIVGKAGDQEAGGSARQEELRLRASARSAIFCSATRCASTESIRTARLPGCPSAPTRNGCRRCSPAPSTAPTSPIPPTCRPSAKDTAC